VGKAITQDVFREEYGKIFDGDRLEDHPIADGALLSMGPELDVRAGVRPASISSPRV
jgi:hypothetical protein